MIPLYPLDGHHIWRGLLSFKAALAYDKMKHYGGYILMFIILFGRFGALSFIWKINRSILGLLFTPAEMDRFITLLSTLF